MHHLNLRALMASIVIALLTGTLLGASPASAAPASRSVDSLTVPFQDTEPVAKKKSKKAGKKKRRAPARIRAFRAARGQIGDPYSYGASGPNAYDCSGLTMWSYARAGKRLPRTSSSQAGATRRVGRPAVGDLVFFHSGGSVYHVGLYAGRNKVLHASRPGTPVKIDRIWTNLVFYGRVR